MRYVIFADSRIFGTTFATLGPRALCPKNMNGGSAHSRQQCQHKHQNAHAPYPVAEAPPEQHALVQSLYPGRMLEPVVVKPEITSNRASIYRGI